MTHQKPKTNIFQTLRHIAIMLAALGSLSGILQAADDARTPGGTVITNRADARYEDENGITYQTVSETVMITVAQVPAIAVTPDETASSAVIAPNERITRLFQICNTGNSPDSFLTVSGTISAPAVISQTFFDTDNSGTVNPIDQPVVFGQTLTPSLAPGTCYGVLYVIDTNAATTGSQIVINLSARSSLMLTGTNRYAEDTGTIINSVGLGANFTSPANTSLPPVKLVENLPNTIAAPGQTLNYSISFRNHGAVTARQVRVTDDLPADLEYVAGTLRLNNRSLTDAADTDEGTAAQHRLDVLIPAIAADAVTEIKFQARLIGVSNGSGVINTAQVSAANASTVATSQAVAVVNPIGTVYAGSTLGTVRIAGAQVTVAADESGTPLVLTPDTGYAPNTANINPFSSDGNGNFSFFLNGNQIGSANAPVRYIVGATAPNYRPRKIEVLITRASVGNFYTAVIRSLDDQPVAVANGFDLTSETVQINDLAALVFNIPMFELSTLEISKTADKQTADIGDIITYRLQVKNSAAYAIHNARVSDTLPTFFDYVAGTAQIESGSPQPIEPTVNGNQLTFALGDLQAGATTAISYRVRIGASATEGQHYNTAVLSGTQPNGTVITTQPAKAGVNVRGGVFSTRQVIIGRVFEDKNLNGSFDPGERPVIGARVYMNNGQSVITDSAGLYNIPAAGEGSMVLSLDPLTVPDNYFLTDDKNRRSSKSWTRLLQTPLGGGMLLRQNFAIAPASDAVRISDERKTIDVNVKTKPLTAEKLPAPSKAPIQIASANPKMSLGIRAGSPTNSNEATDKKTGTFTVETTEAVEPVAAGNILILSPARSEVIMTPALSIAARVAKDWTVEAEVNGERVSSSNIGETRVDNRNQVTTYSFVGINIRPGANTVKLTAVRENGERGVTEEIKVIGRGAAEKLEIVPSKKQLQAGGREAVAVEIRAFDHWNNPAVNSQVAVETSAGHFLIAKDEVSPEGKTATPETARRTAVSLENGLAVVYLVADSTAETAKLKAVSGTREATAEIRITPELRPQLLVGLAEYSFGQNAPAIQTSGSDANYRGRLAFYFRGRFFGDKNLLTLSYDSQKALNRLSGRDRIGTFDPLDRAYPIFGDASQRFEDAKSNSKVYARFDRGNSFAMFGDMETDQQDLQLSGYTRRLTGVKVRLGNDNGDFVALTGARPDTAFARDLFPGGGLSLARLSHSDILQGSELVALEVRDRRSPEIIVKREQLVRSVDYNIDAGSGEIFFLRPISAFDSQLNLIQIVATYEYRGTGSAQSVYTGRGVKNFRGLGLRVGASYVNQRQGEIGAFQLGGLDAEKTLWNGGKLNLEAAMSNGRYASGVNVFDFNNGGFAVGGEAGRERNGVAVKLGIEQPLPFLQSRLRADFARAGQGFYNPYGATQTAGSQRLQVNLDMHPSPNRTFGFGYTDERNKTSNVSNSRNTFSALWSEKWNNQIRTTLGFDRRHLSDNLTDKTTDSNLVTAGVEYRPTDKVEVSVKREQNLTGSDPTYPNQTTFAASYAVNPNAKLFFTQRLASAAINPIGDFSGSGFASSTARNEMSFGIETKVAYLGAVNGRYQIENGSTGADNFAVIGLQNRWKLTKAISIEAGAERGFLVKGLGRSFNSGTFGASWTPVDGFRLSGRYEIRDRNGLGQLFSIGAAGKIGENWTTLARAQFSQSSFAGRHGSSSNITGAFAYRPLNSDKYAVLFSYNNRKTDQGGTIAGNFRQAATRDRSDTLSSDGLYQLSRSTEIYGRFALRFNGNGTGSVAYASALTYMAQARIQQRLNSYFDIAAEGRWLAQAGSNTYRRSAGAEVGFWAMPDLRLGTGYNFWQAGIAGNSPLSNQYRGGFYFTITTKLSNLFDLFGTSRSGLSNDIKPETNIKPDDK